VFPILAIFFKKDIFPRLGLNIPSKKETIWFHAASVGEINAIKPLILKMLKQFPNREMALSVTSKTGLENATKISPKLSVFIYPLDLFFLIGRIFSKLQPQCIVLMETEWWPSMLYFAKVKKIPIVMVNARLTESSIKDYEKTKFFWKPLWKAITVIGAQSAENKSKFQNLGFKNVVVTKNLKFHAEYPLFPEQVQSKWNVTEDDFVIVWGSSRPGEETLLKSILPSLKATIPNLKLIVCPRHLPRLEEVKAIFPEHQLYSIMKGNYEILIIDMMGVLLEAYSLCDIAIVGGSFYDFGGHNPLEPAFYGKTIIMGEFHSSCKESVEMLAKKDAIVISSPNALERDIENIYNVSVRRKQLGSNAKQVMKENCDSLENNLQLILPYLEQ
jgi:3-deoxy-D-manno-octulosonic-acid transferase